MALSIMIVLLCLVSIMLNVMHAECPYAKCHGECQYADCHYDEVDRHYAEYCYAECRGTTILP
jgi:hypothetical protein